MRDGGPTRQGLGIVPAIAALVAAAIAALALNGCSSGTHRGPVIRAATDERECLVRAMYFESNRSSHEGSLAVGTVVMNRVEARRFPNTICGVVGQHRQFAPGVLTKRLDPRQMKTAVRAADAVLKGERYRPVGRAMHFHAASYKNPYPAKYVTVAGGNAFYLRPGRRWQSAYTGSLPRASASPKAPPAQSLLKRAACDTGDGPGAFSLACESEAAGR